MIVFDLLSGVYLNLYYSRGEIDISSNPDSDASAEQTYIVQGTENQKDGVFQQISPTRHHVIHRRSLSNPAPRIDTSVAAAYGVPTTPELSGATYSPDSPLSAVPHTPLYPHPGPLPTSFNANLGDVKGDVDAGKVYRNPIFTSAMRDVHDREGEHREIDPKTIFVGGLETMGVEEWDEHRLRAVFCRYGTIEHVKYVRQSES